MGIWIIQPRSRRNCYRKILKIEFHPGDILYFINDEQIGSTGPHYELQTIPYEKVEQLLSLKKGRQLFLLLLPLAFVEGGRVTVCQR
ncbi:MAG: immunity protein 19 [Lachnospiraceae bacterium]|nr:immunity protein 19 [Lachnospiraceae bacterium]